MLTKQQAQNISSLLERVQVRGTQEAMVLVDAQQALAKIVGEPAVKKEDGKRAKTDK